MPKILMTSVREDEEAAIAAYAQQHQVEIDISRDELHPDNLPDLRQYDGLIVQQTAKIGGDAAFYRTLAQQGLQQITTRTAGYDMIEVALAKEAGLKVTNVPAYSPRSVAEMALMQIFRLLRRTWAFDHRVAQHDFRWGGLQAREIHTVTVGIIGAGRIGSTLAQLLHALGARVLAYDINPQPAYESFLTYVDKETLLAESGIVSLHVDLNPSSVGLLSAADFERMPAHAGLVNASRGPVVNTDALITALVSGEIEAAALDTVEGESAVFNHDLRQQGVADQRIQQLLDLPNVIMTPHVAFYTNLAVQNMIDIALDDVLLIIQGQPALHEI